MNKQTVAQLRNGIPLCNKKDKLLTPVSEEMKFKCIVLGERSQMQKFIRSHLYNTLEKAKL